MKEHKIIFHEPRQAQSFVSSALIEGLVTVTSVEVDTVTMSSPAPLAPGKVQFIQDEAKSFGRVEKCDFNRDKLMQEKRTVEQMLASLYERERDIKQGELDKLAESYKSFPHLINAVSTLSGIEPAKVLLYAIQATRHYASLTPRQALEIIGDFYISKRNDENPQEE